MFKPKSLSHGLKRFIRFRFPRAHDIWKREARLAYYVGASTVLSLLHDASNSSMSEAEFNAVVAALTSEVNKVADEAERGGFNALAPGLGVH